MMCKSIYESQLRKSGSFYGQDIYFILNSNGFDPMELVRMLYDQPEEENTQWRPLYIVCILVCNNEITTAKALVSKMYYNSGHSLPLTSYIVNV